MNVRLSPERKLSIVRDISSLVVGLGGIIYQQLSGQYNLTLLIVFMAMVGTPGLTNVIGYFRESGRVIDLRSSGPQELDSSSDSSKLQKSSDGER